MTCIVRSCLRSNCAPCGISMDADVDCALGVPPGFKASLLPAD